MGRKLVVPLAAEGVARFDFAALCGTALGAGDYLALATHFHTLILDGIPRLSPDNYDVARRFIMLIDTLYDHRVKLVASADSDARPTVPARREREDVRAHGVATGRDAKPGLAGAAASDVISHTLGEFARRGEFAHRGELEHFLPDRKCREDHCHCEARSAEAIPRLTSVPRLVRREIASSLGA